MLKQDTASFTITVPALIWRASRSPRARSRVQTLAASPKSESLARRTASASSRERRNRQHRAEGFFLHHAHVVIDVGQHGGRKKSWAQIAQPCASGQHASAALPRVLYLRFHHAHLPLVDHGADFGCRVHAIADAQLARLLAARIQERGVQTLMHVAAFDRQAGLAGVHERSPNRAARGDLDVGIFEHQHGVLAAQFEHHRKQAFGGDLRDSAAGGDASREDQFVDVAGDQRRSSCAFAWEHLENVVGNSSLARATTRSSSAISGVNSEGLSTTAFPATSAAMASVAGIENG